MLGKWKYYNYAFVGISHVQWPNSTSIHTILSYVVAN